MVEEPFHGDGIEPVAVLVAAIGVGPRDRVGHRIDEQLQAKLGAAMVTRPQGHCGGEIAAGAVAPDGEPGSVDADRGAVGRHPLQAGHDIVESAGEARLRRQAIVDGEHRNARLERELGA